MKTFGERAQILKEQEGAVNAPMPVTGATPPLQQVKPPDPLSFGQKATATVYNKQVNLPKTPFNLASLAFHNRKYYYLNRFGSWRNLDEEEAIKKFIIACDAMINSGSPSASQPESGEATSETGEPDQGTGTEPAPEAEASSENLPATTAATEPALPEADFEMLPPSDQVQVTKYQGGSPANQATPQVRRSQSTRQLPNAKKQLPPSKKRLPNAKKQLSAPRRMRESFTTKLISDLLFEFRDLKSGVERDNPEGGRIASVSEALNKTLSKYGVRFIKQSAAVSMQKNIVGFLNKISTAFPEYEIEFNTNVKSAKLGTKDAEGNDIGGRHFVEDESVKRNSVERGISRDVNPDNIRARVIQFSKSIGAQIVSDTGGTTERDHAGQFYDNIPVFLEEINNIYVDRTLPEAGELHFKYNIITRRSDPSKAEASGKDFKPIPFNTDGTINEFEPWVNIMKNRVVEQTRNNVGVSPYMVLESYISASGKRDQTGMEDKIAKRNAKTASTVPMELGEQASSFDEMLAEAGERYKTSPNTTAGGTGRGAYRTQRGGEIYHTTRRLSQHRKDETEELGHITSEQVMAFHEDVIKYFIKPGLLVYLYPEQHDKYIQKGGILTDLVKKTGQEIYSAGASYGRVQT